MAPNDAVPRELCVPRQPLAVRPLGLRRDHFTPNLDDAGTVCGVVTVTDNIEDGQEIYLEDDSDCGLTFAYHLACAEVADAEGERFDYETRGGRLQ